MSKFFVFLSAFLVSFPLVIYPATLSNPYLLVNVDDTTGRFFLSTVEGLPDVKGDERKNLLFYDTPPSSYTLIYVDDDVYVFGGERGSFTKPPVTVGNSIEAVWGNRLISVTQTIRFIKKRGVDVEDSIQILYTLKNMGERSVKAGFRVLLDTSLGEKNRSHFILSGGKKIEYESRFEGDEIPAAWFSQDREENPVVCLQGVLRGQMVSVPSKVVFANYRSLQQNPIDYSVLRRKRFHNLPYSRDDSAVALYSELVDLAQGESCEFKTILGLPGGLDYGAEEEEIVVVREERKKVSILSPEAIARLESKTVDRQDLKRMLGEYSNLIKEKESLSELNRIIEKLNSLLNMEDKSVSEEELFNLKMGIRKIRERAQ